MFLFFSFLFLFFSILSHCHFPFSLYSTKEKHSHLHLHSHLHPHPAPLVEAQTFNVPMMAIAICIMYAAYTLIFFSKLSFFFLFCFRLLIKACWLVYASFHASIYHSVHPCIRSSSYFLLAPCIHPPVHLPRSIHPPAHLPPSIPFNQSCTPITHNDNDNHNHKGQKAGRKKRRRR